MSVIADGNNILQWRSTVEMKYGDLPGIRKLHDFLTFRCMNDEVKTNVRSRCYTGCYAPSTLVVVHRTCVLPVPESYEPKKHELSEQKLSHMLLMYKRWIDPSRWPLFLPSFSQLDDPPAGPSQSAARRQRKPSKYSTPGCKGVGHKNPAKWSQGHSTRAGCPIFHA